MRASRERKSLSKRKKDQQITHGHGASFII